MKQNRFWILCVVLFCAVLLLVSAATASTTASITITGVYKGVPPLPDFTYTPASPITGESVVFTGTSTGSPVSWSWTFGDGGTSSLQNPTHTYTSTGTKTVTLTVTNSAGLTGTKSKPITVTAPPLTAAFTATQTNCACSWKVTFNDISTGTYTSRAWAYQKVGSSGWNTFGSGLPSPSLSFSTSAPYNIRLTVSDAAGNSNTLIKTITPGTLKAAFSASTTSGIIPLTITFTDTSVGMPTSWKWEYQKKTTTTWTTFASGTGAQNPSFSPTTSGKYSIRLTVTNTAAPACGSNTVTKTDYITVMSPCDSVVASFSGSPIKGWNPLTVKFTDSSSGPIGTWEWDFQNDGPVDSPLQNPSFTYTITKTYSVKLKVTNVCGTGTSTLTKTSYITVK